MTLKKFAQKNYFYLTVASMYFIQSKLKIFHSFIHSFHVGSHTLMNDFKSSYSEESILKSCMVKSNYLFWP